MLGIEDKEGREGTLVKAVGSDTVLVEFDGDGIRCIPAKNIKRQWPIFPESESKCCNCIFSTGLKCLRYSPGALGMLFANKNHTRVPTRIYPYCKEEVGGLCYQKELGG